MTYYGGRLTDAQMKDLLSDLSTIDEYQKKQLAMMLIAETLTDVSVKHAFKLLRIKGQ